LSKSASWSFGVILWELYGGSPYHGKSIEDVKEEISSGQTLPKPVSKNQIVQNAVQRIESGQVIPRTCSDLVWQLIQKCWQFHPKDRIDLDSIYESLLNIQNKECEPRYKKKISDADLSAPLSANFSYDQDALDPTVKQLQQKEQQQKQQKEQENYTFTPK